MSSSISTSACGVCLKIDSHHNVNIILMTEKVDYGILPEDSLYQYNHSVSYNSKWMNNIMKYFDNHCKLILFKK